MTEKKITSFFHPIGANNGPSASGKVKNTYGNPRAELVVGGRLSSQSNPSRLNPSPEIDPESATMTEETTVRALAIMTCSDLELSPKPLVSASPPTQALASTTILTLRNPDTNKMPVQVTASDTTSDSSSSEVVDIPLPTDISRWREKLFNVEERLYLNIEEYRTYWPFVENCFVHCETKENPATTLNHYRCRYRSSDGKACSFKIRVTESFTVTTLVKITRFYRIERMNKATHKHPMEDCDKLKTSDGLRRHLEMYFERTPMTSDKTVIDRLWGHRMRPKIEMAGGKFLTKHAVTLARYRVEEARLEQAKDIEGNPKGLGNSGGGGVGGLSTPELYGD
ncbi:hypothetical protein EDC01DRAFT_353299 [Geopyxis carbonaria]|nr:hypothetical protein EDC01DRAFT_353299 [Geopyxis carbonaria]